MEKFGDSYLQRILNKETLAISEEFKQFIDIKADESIDNMSKDNNSDIKEFFNLF